MAKLRRGSVTVAVLLACIVGCAGPLLAGEKKEVAKPAARAKPGTAQEAFAAFLKQPNKESYLRALEALTASDAYQPYSLELHDAEKLLAAKKSAEAQALLKKAMPNLVLSPRAHLLAARAARSLGDTETAVAEYELYRKCLEGILGSGDGTPDRPYLVSRVTDEYDVLQHLKKAREKQALMHKDGKSLDAIHCADGSTVFFDVTAAFESLGRRFKESGKK